jgi:uncharacterized phiE125 gp8 family phage protein
VSYVLSLTDNEITPPAKPALTVPYARAHLKSLGFADDVMIRAWIQAATQFIEGQTGRQLITATREVWLDAFPTSVTNMPSTWSGLGSGLRVELPRPPLQRVISVTYVDGSGTEQVFTDGASPETPYFQAKTPTGVYARRGWVEPIAGQTWPSTQTSGGSVRIRYVAGYGDDPDDVPELLQGVICFFVALFDQNRSPLMDVKFGELPFGIRTLLEEFKYTALPSTQMRGEGA